VKFGISFTKALLNQAGALVQIYTDGSVQLNHSGTEMGQGLHTKMMAVCAHELGISLDSVRVMHTSTEKVPNTSPTAASSGSDLNGQAVRIACATLVDRLRPLAQRMLGVDSGTSVLFQGGFVSLQNDSSTRLPFSQLCNQAWVEQISLSATGYYRTPGIAYDEEKGRGTPFFYFAYGAAITEVELSTLTGEYRIVRTDILHDVGDSISPDIDKGQVEGAYVQGIGWISGEELLYTPQGKLLTYAPSTYKIPAAGDIPLDFHVHLLPKATQDGVIHGSKAVGEPPFMLGISLLTALRHGIASVGGNEVQLRIPATTEAVLRAVYAQSTSIEEEPPLIRY
jgi:xanthine dehydrogenase molybdopterin-binding subunit B